MMLIFRMLWTLIIVTMMAFPWNAEAGGPKNVWVKSYTRSDGTRVRGHWRSAPGGGMPFSPLIVPSVGSTCYIPDYSMSESGSPRYDARTITKEGLDLTKCAVGKRGGAGECEGFRITVTDGNPSLSVDDSKRFWTLSSFCSPSDVSNLPGGASVVCYSDPGLKSPWTLLIVPIPICTAPDDPPPTPTLTSHTTLSAPVSPPDPVWMVTCRATRDLNPHHTPMDRSTNPSCPKGVDHQGEPMMVDAERNGYFLTLRIERDGTKTASTPGYEPVRVRFAPPK